MKIKSIYVKNLFGIFNHKMELNKEGITIAIGENGLGKTVMLEMIDSFFNSNNQYFKSVEFDSIIFEFDDSVIWIIDKEETYLNVKEEKKGKEPIKFKIEFFNREELFEIAEKIAEEMPRISRRGKETWIDFTNREILRCNDIIKKYQDNEYLHDICIDVPISLINKPEWFSERIQKLNVNLIRTQRLLLTEKDMDSHSTTQSVDKYSRELSIIIRGKLTESSALSSNLDRTYPKRLINSIKRGREKINSDDLLKKLNELEEKREMLSKVGLMDIGEEADILKTDDLDKSLINDLLMQYVTDSFDKLAIFDEISQKIGLLLNIINSRFKHKKLYIDRSKGFSIKSTVIKDENGNYKSIPVNKLSSGEQNELVLFYELIFKTRANSLILIDEPEISLHITWQNNFIKDLREIIEMNNLDVLIATHSPDIIGNNWGFKIDLKGVE